MDDSFNEELNSILGLNPSLDSARTSRTKPGLMQYNEEFLFYGFTWNGDKNDPKPKCIICDKTFSNSAMTPSKLYRHLHNVHPNRARKSKVDFQRILKEKKMQQKMMSSSFVVSEKELEASYHIAKLIACQKVPYNIGETIVKPACMEMVRIMFGPEHVEKIKKIPLSSDVIKKRIGDMSGEILESLVYRLIPSEKFALQIVELSIENQKQLLAFVRLVDEGAIKEHFLFYKELSDSSITNVDIFQAIDNFFKTNCIEWINCTSICMDDSALENTEAFITSTEEENPNLQITNCFINRSKFMSENLPEELSQTMNECIRIVNAIKSSGHTSRIFKILSEEMGSQYQSLFLYTDKGWLSHGKVLVKIYEHRQEISRFLLNQNMENLHKHLEDALWTTKLIYLADIFEKLNQLNKKMEQHNENIFSCYDKLSEFKKNIIEWQAKLRRKSLQMFERTKKFANENIIKLALQHLILLEQKFDNFSYIKNLKIYEWVRNPFIINTENSLEGFSLQMLNEFSGLKNSEAFKTQFENCQLDAFWIAVRNEFPSIGNEAIAVLLSFTTNSLCEIGLSTLLSTVQNGKPSDRKNLDEELRVALTKIDPNIEILSSL